MRALLIPCAGGLPIDMQAEFGPVPAATLPLGGGIVLEKMIAQVLADYDLILVALAEEFNVVASICRRLSPKIRLINVGRTGSLAETVLRLGVHLPQEVQSVTVQMGDAFHSTSGPFHDSLSVCEDRFNSRWVTVRFTKDGMIEKFVLPGAAKPATDDLVFAGKFSVSDPAAFFRSLKAACPNGQGCADALFVALAGYFNARGRCPLVNQPDWQDFGYLSSYYRFRRLSGFNERQFNAIEFDIKRSTVIKRSASRAKFIDEIHWYEKLPEQLTYLAPRIYRSQVGAAPWIEMEYLAGIPLDQLWLFARLDGEFWRNIWGHVESTLNVFRESGGRELDQRTAADKMYREKTAERMGRYLTEDRFKSLLSGEHRVNGHRIPNLAEAQKIIERTVGESEFMDGFISSVIHGDLCFSNIVYDSRLDKITLIDPRGGFGFPGVHGDLRYDLAKLSHSASGRYDFLVNGHFTLRSAAQSHELQELMDPGQKAIGDQFDDAIRNFCGKAHWQVVFIEALLFLTMVPLHADKPESQTAFILRGLEKLQRSMEIRKSL